MRVHDLGGEAADEARQAAELGPIQQALRADGLCLHAHAAEIGPEGVQQRARRGQRQAELAGIETTLEREHDFLHASTHG